MLQTFRIIACHTGRKFSPRGFPWQVWDRQGLAMENNLIVKANEKMSLGEKLTILSAAAKYDVSCSSSGVGRRGDGTGIGNTLAAGICHSFGADGRCISLLKILFTNECIYDCKYCINRK